MKAGDLVAAMAAITILWLVGYAAVYDLHKEVRRLRRQIAQSRRKGKK